MDQSLLDILSSRNIPNSLIPQPDVIEAPSKLCDIQQLKLKIQALIQSLRDGLVQMARKRDIQPQPVVIEGSNQLQEERYRTYQCLVRIKFLENIILDQKESMDKDRSAYLQEVQALRQWLQKEWKHVPLPKIYENELKNITPKERLTYEQMILVEQEQNKKLRLVIDQLKKQLSFERQKELLVDNTEEGGLKKALLETSRKLFQTQMEFDTYKAEAQQVIQSLEQELAKRPDKKSKQSMGSLFSVQAHSKQKSNMSLASLQPSQVIYTPSLASQINISQPVSSIGHPINSVPHPISSMHEETQGVDPELKRQLEDCKKQLDEKKRHSQVLQNKLQLMEDRLQSIELENSQIMDDHQKTIRQMRQEYEQLNESYRSFVEAQKPKLPPKSLNQRVTIDAKPVSFVPVERVKIPIQKQEKTVVQKQMTERPLERQIEKPAQRSVQVKKSVERLPERANSVERVKSVEKVRENAWIEIPREPTIDEQKSDPVMQDLLKHLGRSKSVEFERPKTIPRSWSQQLRAPDETSLMQYRQEYLDKQHKVKKKWNSLTFGLLNKLDRSKKRIMHQGSTKFQNLMPDTKQLKLAMSSNDLSKQKRELVEWQQKQKDRWNRLVKIT